MVLGYRFVFGLLVLIAFVVNSGCAVDSKRTVTSRAEDEPSSVESEPSAPSGPEYVAPEVAVDSNGNVYVVWLAVEWRKSWDVLFASSRDHGITWSAPRSLKPDKATVAGGLRLVTFGAGRLMVAWREWHPKAKMRSSVVLHSKDGGVGWDSPIVLPASSRTLGHATILSVGGGSVAAAWMNGDKEKRFLEIVSSGQDPLSFPSVPVKLTTVAPDSQMGIQNHDFSTDGEGNLYAVWQEVAGPSNDFFIHFSRSPDGGKTWSAQRVVLNPKRERVINSQQPLVLAGPNGRIYVLWKEYVPSKHQPRPEEMSFDRVLAFNRSEDYGKTWLPTPVRINQERSSKISSSDAQLAADRHGNVFITWIEGELPEPQQLYLARSTDGGMTWTLPRVRLDLTSPFKKGLFAPEIRHDESGHIWVLWQELTPSPRGWQLLVNKSEDYGRSWLQQAVPITGPVQSGEKFRSLSFHTDPAGHLYVVWEGGPGTSQKLYLNRSQDFGVTWLPRERRLGEPNKGT